MKLSSISLIAVTLAAITGCAIATPVPLHVRALQQGERDIEIYSREAEVVVEREVNGELVDLVARHKPNYKTVTKDLRESALSNVVANLACTSVASQSCVNSHDRDEWLRKGQKHLIASSDLTKRREDRLRHPSRQVELQADMDLAKHHRGEAKKTIEDAKRFVTNPHFVPTGAASKALSLLGKEAGPAINGQKSVYDRVNHVHT